MKFGKSLGLETITDEVGNVIIRKPATAGMENRKGVILQGHLDMVPQKNSDKVHDFEKDPIDAVVDGGLVGRLLRGGRSGGEQGKGHDSAASPASMQRFPEQQQHPRGQTRSGLVLLVP